MIKNKHIFLAEKYDLVVGDKFELFYRGVIRKFNPYNNYILVECKKGNPFPRYYTFTPTAQDEGEYDFKISIFDDDQNIIETASSKIVVHNIPKVHKTYNCLCFGDSLTYNGVWVKEGYRRLTRGDGSPKGSNLPGAINLMGRCITKLDEEDVRYEGYGSWTWKSYCTTFCVSADSAIWVDVLDHNLLDRDQHSIWLNHDAKWVIESIEPKRIKFKRGENNRSVTPIIDKQFTRLDNPSEVIDIKGYSFERGNPFYDEELKRNNFKKYAAEMKVDKIDLVYILLTWNGLYIPYNTDFEHHFSYARAIIEQIHRDYKDAHITIIGIPICSVNGGIAYSYGATGPYSDTFGTISTAFNYNYLLEQLTKNYDYCSFIDLKAQFDSEYNMPYEMRTVNARSDVLEAIGNNGVHPNMNGYLQMGDVFYRALIADLNELEKKKEF